MTARPINYIDIIRALCDEQVDFVICGGVACVLQGVQRVTHDIDINVAMDSDNLERLVAAARRLGFQPRSPEPLEAIVNPAKRKSWI